jgi:heat shock protein HtpX
LRLLMAMTGVVVLVLYTTAAFVVYRGLLYVWARRPDPVTTAAVVLALTVALGYASYRGGVASLCNRLDAQEIPRHRAPELYRRVEMMAEDLGIDPPAVAVGRMGQPNALAIGGVVVVDPGLFRLLDAAELEAILAHELAHLETRDALIKTLGSSLVRTFTGLAVVASLPVVILVMGGARGLAYIRAVELTGRPVALAHALARIDRAAKPTAGLLSDLVIHGDEEGTLTRLLATHPPMEDRIERLVERAETDARVSGRARSHDGEGIHIEAR